MPRFLKSSKSYPLDGSANNAFSRCFSHFQPCNPSLPPAPVSGGDTIQDRFLSLKIIAKLLPTLICALVLFLAGCVPATLAPPRAPLSAGQEERLWERVRDNGQQYQSLRGLAKVQVSRQGKNAGVNQVLVVEKPDRFRAETLNPFGFGSPLLLMATDGRELAVMVPGEGRMFRGEATSLNLQRFTQVPLYLEDLIQFILYQVPLIPYDESRAYRIADGRMQLELRDGDRRQEIYFNDREQLLETSYYAGEELTLRVRYDNFSPEEKPFPLSASLEIPGRQARASLVFTELQTNVAPDAALFLLDTPPGYEEVPIPE